MNTDRIIPVNKEHLLLMQVLCWLAPGIIILKKGVMAMFSVHAVTPERVWWLTLIAVAVAVSFSLMFNNFIKRVSIPAWAPPSALPVRATSSAGSKPCTKLRKPDRVLWMRTDKFYRLFAGEVLYLHT